MSFSVILPTLNEKGHILNLIDEISIIFENKKINFEIIVVDDNSIDGTIEKIQEYKLQKKFLKLILKKTKRKILHFQ